MEWYTKVLKNYVTFSGRARRKEYWMFQLMNFIAQIVVALVSVLVLDNPILVVIYVLATILPNISVLVRRLHDTGRSGWFFFISLVPLVGGIILLIFLIQDSREENQYGDNPKLATAE